MTEDRGLGTPDFDLEPCQLIKLYLTFFRNVGLEANLRSVRKPQEASLASLSQLDEDGMSYTEFRDENGQIQPIYKYYKKYPHGYSG